jgi:hypothetical protein
LPFQDVSGNQTSTVIDGLLTATTRQNGGRFCRDAELPGGAKSGPGCSSADLIVVSGSCKPRRFAHDPEVGNTAGTGAASAPAVPKMRIIRRHTNKPNFM